YCKINLSHRFVPFGLLVSSKPIIPKVSLWLIFQFTPSLRARSLMCPMMSFIATLLYYWGEIISLWAFISIWLHTIMHNFPLALFSQLFFIQPLVRTIFGFLFKGQLKQVEVKYSPQPAR
ncbi:MAG: hypothetical protein KBA30_05715, partial [Clostridia bacterium]|nr:hypothetical protein [Clostridia bacterium]